MSTRRITQSTDGKFIGGTVEIVNGEAIVNGGEFTFEIVSVTANRIVRPNYSVSFEEE